MRRDTQLRAGQRPLLWGTERARGWVDEESACTGVVTVHWWTERSFGGLVEISTGVADGYLPKALVGSVARRLPRPPVWGLGNSGDTARPCRLGPRPR